MYEVAPFSTDAGELAPPELEIAVFFVTQPIVVEYSKENRAIKRIHR